MPEEETVLLTSQAECYSSWTSYYRDLTNPLSNAINTSFTLVEQYETIQRFGPGTVYHNRDENVPRFRFTGNITRSESYTVNVTKTVTVMEYSQQGEVPPVPCQLDTTHCDLLWAAYHKELRASGLNPVPIPPRVPCLYARKCELQAGNDEVMLIYFPPDTASSNPDSPDGSRTSSTVVMTAITFSGQDLYYRRTVNLDDIAMLRDTRQEKQTVKYITASVMTGNFTFVSPTVYLAHHAITAVVSRDLEGFAFDSTETMSLMKAGIIPLHPTDVYSLSPVFHSTIAQNKTQYAQLVAQGKFDPQFRHLMHFFSTEPYPHTTKPFNFDHLQQSVPADVYFDARAEDCWGKQTHCGTITDGTYRPRLYIKGNYWQKMFPKEFDCAAPALVDPPLALSRISEIQKPRLPYTQPFVTLAFNNLPEVRPTGAQPGIAITPSLPTPTGRTERVGYDSGAVNMVMGGRLGIADEGRQNGQEGQKIYGKQGGDKTQSGGRPASDERQGHDGRGGGDKSQGGKREGSGNGYENPTKTRSGMSAAEDGIHSRPAVYANTAASSIQTVKWLLVLHSLWMMAV
jgi:hypothetical protein